MRAKENGPQRVDDHESEQTLDGSLGLGPCNDNGTASHYPAKQRTRLTQPIGVGKFLDEVFDGVLSEPEKVGTGDRVGVLAIADRVCLLDDR